MLERYKQLLEQYHGIISGRDWWDERLETLGKEMNAIWGKLTAGERQECLKYAERLYAERINEGAAYHPPTR